MAGSSSGDMFLKEHIRYMDGDQEELGSSSLHLGKLNVNCP